MFKVQCRYDKQLERAKGEGIRKGFFSSLVAGMFYLIMFSTYALAFW